MEFKKTAERGEKEAPTIFMERESLLRILTERERFLLNSNAGGDSFPSIKFLRPLAREPNTLLSSQMLTYRLSTH